MAYFTGEHREMWWKLYVRRRVLLCVSHHQGAPVCVLPIRSLLLDLLHYHLYSRVVTLIGAYVVVV